jgi:hypothetical protein
MAQNGLNTDQSGRIASLTVDGRASVTQTVSTDDRSPVDPTVQRVKTREADRKA